MISVDQPQLHASSCLVPQSVEHDGVEADDEEQWEEVGRDEEDGLKGERSD